MTIPDDWIAKASEEIESLGHPYESWIGASTAAQIIEKHCPFKRDTAYVDLGQLRALEAQIDCGGTSSTSCLSQDAAEGPCKRHLVINAILQDERRK